jgi:comEA protein
MMNLKNTLLTIFCVCAFALFGQSVLAANAVDVSEGQLVAVAAKVDVNNADVDTLMSLPGIGSKTAEAIDSYRKENGRFQSVDDLLKVKGIGPKKLEKIKPLVIVS